MIKGCETLFQCYESSKELIEFIQGNPIIRKVVECGSEDEEASALLVENFLPWSVLLKWEKGPVFALHGNPGRWEVEEFEAHSSGLPTPIGDLDLTRILKAMGVSAHEVAEETAKGSQSEGDN